MNKLFFIMLISTLLAGCSSVLTPAEHPVPATSQPDQSTATKTSSLQITFTPGATKPVVNSPAPVMQATPAITPSVSGLVQSSGSLTVEVFSEPDVIVDVPNYVITGRAPAGTVLSVNDEILVIDASQEFKVEINLEEGPNLVELVGSNEAGEEVSFLITVTYNAQ